MVLNMVPGLGPVRVGRLLEAFGGPERVLAARRAELRRVEGVGEEVAGAIAAWEDTVDLAGELRRVDEFGARVVTRASEEYPRLLREIHDPPIVLYVWGELTARDHHGLAMVGSRRATHYGVESAKRLAYQIAYAGLTIVSGLARGIDTACHQGALAAKGRTVAVIGSGLARLYPPENQALAERIAASGAVVSEFPMETEPDRQTFPIRNRLISGWAFGLVVVEAGANSGAMITARQGLEQGRSIYAVPGPIDRPTSLGSNRLIQQGAKLVIDAADILDDMQALFPAGPTPPRLEPRAAPRDLSEEETAVYAALGEGETEVDRIIAKTRLPSSVVLSTLLGLEMRRLVKQLPGQRYVRLG